MEFQVFEPEMCCPTGLCGSSVDPGLERFAEDVAWLLRHEVEIRRYNLSMHPEVFEETLLVKELLAKEGEACLPLLLGDGAVLCTGRYPTRTELAQYAGVELRPSIFTDAVRELVAIGASIAANCEPCFKYHYNQARAYGVSKDDMRLAVEAAQAVKDTPARSILELAEKYLREQPAQKAPACCCGPTIGGQSGDATPGKGSCC